MKTVGLLALVVAAVAPTAVPAQAAEQRRCAPGSYRQLETSRVAYGAAANRRMAAYRAPRGAVIRRFGRLNVNRVPTVFGVVGARVDARCRATWFYVRLPIRPNGTMGWVRARDVTTGKVTTRIIVNLGARRLTLLVNGRTKLVARAAVGSPATPTPRGHYYVTQRLLSGNARGPYGPVAIGVSSYSNVHTGWAQGGPIGIHGTNEPRSIGQAVTNGCVRVRNAVIRQLFRLVPSGTPVIVR